MATQKHDPRDNKAPMIIAAGVVMGVLSTFFILVRMIARRFLNKKWDWSDHFLCAGFLGTWYINAATFVGITMGFGRHVEYIEPKNLKTMLMLTFSAQFVYVLSITSIKISILLWYRTIFVAKRHIIAIYVVGGLVVCWAITFIVAGLLACDPVASWWLDMAVCHALTPFYVASAATNSGIDVIMLAIPVWAISGLALKTREKSNVTGLFLFGGIVIGATVARLISAFFFSIDDMSYSYVSSVISAIVEVNLAVISACLPLVPSLLKRCLRSVHHISATSALPPSYSARRSRSIWTGLTSLRGGQKAGNAVFITTNTTDTAPHNHSQNQPFQPTQFQFRGTGYPSPGRRPSECSMMEMLRVPYAGGIQVSKEVVMTFENEIQGLPPPSPSTLPSLAEMAGYSSVYVKEGEGED